MPSRTLLTTLLVLASAILSTRAHPKAREEELKETKRKPVNDTYDDLLESALAEISIPEKVETPAELNEESIAVLRPASPRWWRKFRERIRLTARRIERTARRTWDNLKPFLPLILRSLLPAPAA
ncbi:unnamed protein product [Dibothriocephalus latus]|uniref:Uncharacterized protein n=1 Tax=Dibothriocephalus latus TaxID=60516 RepID=A0A3P7PU38_DIBLA|nr:unnamed protein product [Dibothriocephalus latus]